MEEIGITPLHIIMFLIFFIIIFIMLEYNKFIRLRNKIRQSKSGIEVYLNQRFDLIPNLVECVKGYAKYEAGVLTRIAEAREEYNRDSEKDLKKAIDINNQFNDIIAVAESNPRLESSEQFSNLQRNLVKIESQLQAARRVYNGDVTLYNITIASFPNNIFAGMFGFKEAELFEIEEYKKENIEIDL